jgi:DNA helicase MCM8
LYIDAISIKTIQSNSSNHTTSKQTKLSHNDSSYVKSIDGDVQRKRQKSSHSLSDNICDNTDQNYDIIRRIALSQNCLGIILSSFCSNILGHDLVKFGLLLGLFGGSTMGESNVKDDDFNISNVDVNTNSNTTSDISEGNITIRKDIHVLVVGDPGLGKSELLRGAASIAPRAVSVCGNTATTAGLTVALVRDGRGSSDASIEAGALVLADRFYLLLLSLSISNINAEVCVALTN